MTTLRTIYDPDERSKSAIVYLLAARNTIPHPLLEVDYADGRKKDTRARPGGPAGAPWWYSPDRPGAD